MSIDSFSEKSASFRVCIFTLGCRVNQSESDMFADYFRTQNFEVVDEKSEADLMLVNSCALTEFAEAKTRRAIKFFKKRNPQARVYVTGCYAQTSPESLRKVGVDLVISNVQKKNTARIACDDFLLTISGRSSNFSSQNFTSFEVELSATSNADLKDLGFLHSHTLSDRINLKIQDGCDNACAYCIIPRARGLPRSRDFADIIQDAKNLANRGVREIILTGINMSKFSGSIADLVEEISKIPEIYRIGLGSLEPPVKEVERLCELMSLPEAKLAKHFHISLQSACDKTLQNMRRKYSVKDFFEMLDFIKSKNPKISVGTDIICGFPEETDEDFFETKSTLENSQLSFIHVFTFSARKGTLAALKKPLPLPVRKARSDELRLVAKNLSDKFYNSLVGSEEFALLENRLPSGDYLAHTSNYMQVRIANLTGGLKNTMKKVRILPQKDGQYFAEEL